MRNSYRLPLSLAGFAALLFFILPLSAANAQSQKRMDALVSDYAKAYRVQVYETFHSNRAEYDYRIKRGKEALKLYRELKSQAKKQVIVGWFEVAMQASAPGAHTALPNIPNLDFFGKKEQVASNSAAGGNDSIDRLAQQTKPDWPQPNATTPGESNKENRRQSEFAPQPDPVEDFVSSELQPAGEVPVSSEEQMTIVEPEPQEPVAAEKTMVAETPAAEIEDEEELIGFDEFDIESDDEFAIEEEPHNDEPAFSEPSEADPVVAASENSADDEERSEQQDDVTDDWAEMAIADTAAETTLDGFPGVLETNARIAGHNLAMNAIKEHSKVAFSGEPRKASELAKKLESLFEANREIQELIAMAPTADRENLIALTDLREFTAQFLMQFRGLGADELGMSNADRLTMLRQLEDFTNDRSKS